MTLTTTTSTTTSPEEDTAASAPTTPRLMAELFQKSLGIREDGGCYRHPDVPIMEQGAPCLGSCHFCAMEKQRDIRDDTATTLGTSGQSFFWSSAASLSLTSSFRAADSAKSGSLKSGDNATASKEESSSTSAAQATGEDNSEKQQQQQFFESIVTRWVQVQDGNLQKSIALSTPLILHELRKLETKVHDQGEVIQQQQKTIEELKQTIEAKHESTQELLQTILQSISKQQQYHRTTTSTTGSPNNAAAKAAEVSMELEYESSLKNAPPSTRGVPRRTPSTNKRRPSMSSTCRSVDSGVRQPLTRHDSNRSFTLTELSAKLGAKAAKEALFSASQPLAYSTPLPASELQLLSVSQHHLPPHNSEIALDGSARSFDRTDLPDMEAIFEDGMGGTIATAKKKKFRIPAAYKNQMMKRASAPPSTSRPMEIILETSERKSSERKLLPNSPEEMGMDMGDSLKGNAKAFIENSPLPKPKTEKKKRKDHDDAQSEVKLAAITLDAASAASELSDSDSSDPEDDDNSTLEDGSLLFHDGGGEDGGSSKKAHSWIDSLVSDDEPNDYSIEDLQHVSRYKMIDMYGDRGTYTGTLGTDNDPTGFGTMKYESGRFYKGEWKKGRWNGKGTLLNANGDSYQGDFVSDARHGRGVYRFTSGDVYEGDFFEDNRHGKGKFKFHNGSVYQGDFYMGSFEGQGRYEFEGGFYEGSWKRDEYYGKGKLQYKDGSNYTGKFKRGSAHGFGEERLADGTVRCGLWKRGEFLQECTEEECKKLESKTANSTNKSKTAKA